MPNMVDKLLVRLRPELKRLINAAAKKNRVKGGMEEYTRLLLADHFDRADLRSIPRKRMGRPPLNGNGKAKRQPA